MGRISALTAIQTTLVSMSGGGGDTEQDSSEGDDEIWNDRSDDTLGASTPSAVGHGYNGRAPPADAAGKPKFAKSTRGLTARARAQQEQPAHPEGEAMGLPEEEEEEDGS